jgi:beta-lactamase class D
MKYRSIVLLVFLCFSHTVSQHVKTNTFSHIFKKYGVDGCFVLYDKSAGAYFYDNQERCDSPYLPASTFKIPNSIIALEENLIFDTLQIVRWDSTDWPVKTWNHDQTMSTAMRYSCVWFYVKIAEQVGISKYEKYLYSFDYGNKKTGHPQNKFWLSGDIRISANQQIDFLQKFYEGRLPVSKRSIDIVKKIMVLERTKDYTLSGKTGGTDFDDHHSIMWLVGYVEREKKVFFYAMNFLTEDFIKGNQVRIEITKNILKELKVIQEK